MLMCSAQISHFVSGSFDCDYGVYSKAPGYRVKPSAFVLSFVKSTRLPDLSVPFLRAPDPMMSCIRSLAQWTWSALRYI